MANTTKANILLIAPELSSITDDNVWNLILADVAAMVSSAVFGTSQERAQRYLAAHLLTLASNASLGPSGSGPAKRVRNGSVEVEYQEISKSYTDLKRYDSTKYGQEYINIRKSVIVPFLGVVAL